MKFANPCCQIGRDQLNSFEDISLTNRARDLISFSFYRYFQELQHELQINTIHLTFMQLLTILLEFDIKLSQFSPKMVHISISINFVQLNFF